LGLAVLAPRLSFTVFNRRLGENMPRNNCQRIESIIYSLTNKSRNKQGIRKYRYSKNLSNYARDHSKRMANARDIFHDSNAGFENVAYIFNPGSSDQQIASQFHRQWMKSSGHRSNILNTTNDIIGIGVVRRGSHFYATQRFSQSGIATNFSYSVFDSIYDSIVRPIDKILFG